MTAQTILPAAMDDRVSSIDIASSARSHNEPRPLGYNTALKFSAETLARRTVVDSPPLPVHHVRSVG